jgi:hypothetical protein
VAQVDQAAKVVRVVRAPAPDSAVVRLAALAGRPVRAEVSVAAQVVAPVALAQDSAVVPGVRALAAAAVTVAGPVARAVQGRAPARVPGVRAAVDRVVVAGPVARAAPSAAAAASQRVVSRSVRSGRSSTTYLRRQ